MNDIVKVNPSEFGIEETKAKEVESVFVPMIEKMKELESELNEVRKMEMSEDKCSCAKALRLKYVKVRTGTAKIHKQAKAFYLAGGRFVDGWKNAQLYASQGIESELDEIENHYINIEKERIAKIEEDRRYALEKLGLEHFPSDLGTMPDDVWDNYWSGVKLAKEQAEEAERKAEEDRKKAEEEKRKEEERIRKENERLKLEREKQQEELRKQEEIQRKKDEEAKQKLEEERRKTEELRKRAEAEQRKKDEEAKRANDEKHKKNIKNGIYVSLLDYCEKDNAIKIATAIINNKIDNVKVIY